jgi:hypothetical protein
MLSICLESVLSCHAAGSAGGRKPAARGACERAAYGRRLNVLWFQNFFDQLFGLGVHFVLERAGQGRLGLLARAERPGFSLFCHRSILSVATLLALPEGAKRAVLAVGKVLTLE